MPEAGRLGPTSDSVSCQLRWDTPNRNLGKTH